MIPAGYVSAIVTWATMPHLSDAQRNARKNSLLGEFEALMSGQITGAGKTGQSITSASLNGKAFTFDSSLTKADKLAALSAALRILGVTDQSAVGPIVTYADFSGVIR